MFSLSANVKKQFSERIARLSDAELQNHQKVVAFKDSIKNSLKQGKACAKERWENSLDLSRARLNTEYSGLVIAFDNSCTCKWASHTERERNLGLCVFLG